MESAFVFVQVEYGQAFGFLILYIGDAFGVEQPAAALFLSSVLDVLLERGCALVGEYLVQPFTDTVQIRIKDRVFDMLQLQPCLFLFFGFPPSSY